MKTTAYPALVSLVGFASCFLSSCLVWGLDEEEKLLLVTAEAYRPYGFSLPLPLEPGHFEKTLYWGGRVKYRYVYHPETASDLSFFSMTLMVDPEEDIPEEEWGDGGLQGGLTPYSEAWNLGGASCRLARILSPQGREVGESLAGRGPGYAFQLLVVGLIREDPQIWEDLLTPVLKQLEKKRGNLWK